MARFRLNTSGVLVQVGRSKAATTPRHVLVGSAPGSGAGIQCHAAPPDIIDSHHISKSGATRILPYVVVATREWRWVEAQGGAICIRPRELRPGCAALKQPSPKVRV